MEDTTKRFRDDTRDALLRCADWLTENAEQLADTVAGGCKDWTVECKAGDDGMFPRIRIEVNKIDKRTIGAYTHTEDADEIAKRKDL
jgi:hypothetical protein